MSAEPKPQRMSYAEYLVLLEGGEEKFEYVNGEVYAMAGGTRRHSQLAANLNRALGNALAGRPCQVFDSNLRIRTQPTGGGFFPDATVICGTFVAAPDDAEAATNPTVIIEVLSDATEAFDRGAKAAHYRRLDSLKEYVLVSQHEPRIEVQRRGLLGKWELEFYGAGQRAELTSLGVSLSVDDVYVDPLAAPAA